MPSWDEVLNGIDAAITSYEGAAAAGDPGDVFVLPSSMPELPAALLSRVEELQQRINALASEHERALAAIRPSLAAVSRPANSRTGELLNELA